jgi:hypothetical protein
VHDNTHFDTDGRRWAGMAARSNSGPARNLAATVSGFEPPHKMLPVESTLLALPRDIRTCFFALRFASCGMTRTRKTRFKTHSCAPIGTSINSSGAPSFLHGLQALSSIRWDEAAEPHAPRDCVSG